MKLYLLIISALELKVNKHKKIFLIQYQKLLIILRIPLFRFTFYHSIPYMLLVDKPNESCKNSIKFERNTLSATKKLLKGKEKNIAPAKTKALISQTSSECLKVTIQTYRVGNKKLKMKLGQLHEELSKASLPVSSDLSNDFKSIILETDQRKLSPFMRLLWEEQQKFLQSQNNATYHPMNPDTDVTYKTVNIFSSEKGFIYFFSDVPLYIC